MTSSAWPARRELARAVLQRARFELSGEPFLALRFASLALPVALDPV